MALLVHVANIVMKPVSAAGVVLNKNDMSVGERLTASEEPRILEDGDNANTTGYPTIKAYLQREATQNYVLHHIDQTYVITYQHSALG